MAEQTIDPSSLNSYIKCQSLTRKHVPAVPKFGICSWNSNCDLKICYAQIFSFQNSSTKASLSANSNISRGKYYMVPYSESSLRMVWKNMPVNVPNFLFWSVQQQTLYLDCLFPNSHDNDLKLLDHPIVTKVWKDSPEPRHIKLAKHDCKEGFTKYDEHLEYWSGDAKRARRRKKVQANGADLKIGELFSISAFVQTFKVQKENNTVLNIWCTNS